MNHARLPLGALVVGILLVVLSVMWPRLFGGRAVWTDDDAREHAAAARELHRQLAAGHDGASTDDSATGAAAGTALDTARRRFEASEARLDAARHRGRTTASLFRWLGIALALAGAFTFLALRDQSRGE